ncbi:MAG: ASKHA domain-containing protein [Coriobacteriia bacterium]|nr:ASKHA domain-containing protein [Coriobacteriia bacterium]
MPLCPVSFLPSRATAWVEEGTSVLAASRAAGLTFDAPCGGRGVCGTCGVRVIEGELGEPDEQERAGLKRAPSGVRLACRSQVVGPVVVRPLVAPAAMSAEISGGGRAALVAGVDLGTTNVSVVVVDRATGRQIGMATVPNRQRSFGADVITRITAALGGDAAALSVAASESVASALEVASGGQAENVQRVVIAANTAMAALLVQADVSVLSVAPYAAPVIPSSMEASKIRGLDSEAEVMLVPPLGSFVGGDVLAGLEFLAAAGADSPVLLVDVGTNAEVALLVGDNLTVASAAAGPAFEGVAGLCGSEVVAALADLRRADILDEDGLIRPDGVGVSLDENGVRVVSVGPEEDALLTQLDIRELQLAKAAVFVAVQGVLSAAALSAQSLSRVWVAGAFGGALRPADLVAIGMMPVEVGQVLSAPGNASLGGATKLALSGDLGAVRGYLQQAHHVGLASDPRFAERLLDAVRLAPQHL